jgi:hypothetical protein
MLKEINMPRRYAELTKDNVVKCFFERYDDLVPVFEDHEDYPDPVEVTGRDPEVAIGDVYDRATDTFSKPEPAPAPVEEALAKEPKPVSKKAK